MVLHNLRVACTVSCTAAYAVRLIIAFVDVNKTDLMPETTTM